MNWLNKNLTIQQGIHFMQITSSESQVVDYESVAALGDDSFKRDRRLR